MDYRLQSLNNKLSNNLSSNLSSNLNTSWYGGSISYFQDPSRGAAFPSSISRDFSTSSPTQSTTHKCLLVYFALSAKATLTSAPFTKPLEVMKNSSSAVVSTDLPFHSFGNNELQTVQKWDLEHTRSPSFFSEYLDQISQDIQSLHQSLQEKQDAPLPLALMGISRGAWIAIQVLSRLLQDDEIPTILALLFAPMTQIKGHADTSLMQLPFKRPFESWISIGNQDQMVHTERGFLLHQHLLKEYNESLTGLSKKAKSSLGKEPLPHHFLCHPSIGYKGHGTSDSAFEQGGLWLQSRLAENRNEDSNKDSLVK